MINFSKCLKNIKGKINNFKIQNSHQINKVYFTTKILNKLALGHHLFGKDLLNFLAVKKYLSLQI